jgi:hypothetical protein
MSRLAFEPPLPACRGDSFRLIPAHQVFKRRAHGSSRLCATSSPQARLTRGPHRVQSAIEASRTDQALG